MAVLGTFSQFTTARLALYASQASLSVTGNNISNINTEGYTRQRMDLVSLYSTGQGKYANIFNTNIGYGVLTNGVTRLRDPYLDIRFRNENTKLGAATEKADGLYQIGNILDEVGKGDDCFGVLEAQFGTFFQALEDLETNIGSEEYDDLVRAAATTLTAYFRKASSDLQDIKVNKVGELNDSIDTINGLLTNIRNLNSQIRTQDIYGCSSPELRDARDLAIDELSSYIPITVTYSMEKIDQWTEVEKLTITIKDSKSPGDPQHPIKLVDGIYGGQITMPDRMPVVNDEYDAAKIQNLITNLQQRIRQDPAANGSQVIVPPTGGAYDTTTEDGKALQAAWEVVSQDTAAQDRIAALVQGGMTQADAEKAVYTPMMAEAVRQAVIDTQAAAGNAKYVLVDEQGNQTGVTNDIEAATTPPQGIYNYDERDQINEDALYMLRVEKLVDQRGRVMKDKNDPSLESQVVALDDITFCLKNADSTVDETRVDSNAMGIIQAIRETLTRKGEYSSAEEIERDPYATNKRGITYYELALDSLAQKFAEVFNGMNQLPVEQVYQLDPAFDPTDATSDASFVDADGKDVTRPDGTVIKLSDLTQIVYDNTANPPEPKKDADGNIIREPLTTEQAIADLQTLREKAAKVPGYEFYDGGVLITNNGDNNDPTGITAANISISKAWSTHTVRLLNTTRKNEVDENGNVTDHTTRRDNISYMISQFDLKRDYFAQDVRAEADDPLAIFHGSFREVFTAIGTTLGIDQKTTYSIESTYTQSTLSLDNDRLSVSGVDLNEEATSMMQFSKSYSAACRLLTTIDSMLDTLINGTAR